MYKLSNFIARYSYQHHTYYKAQLLQTCFVRWFSVLAVYIGVLQRVTPNIGCRGPAGNLYLV
jgi:hypothetical protein